MLFEYPRSALLIPINSFFFLVAVSLFAILIDSLDLIPRLIVGISISVFLDPFKKAHTKKIWSCLNIIGSFCGATILGPISTFALQSWENRDEGELGKIVQRVAEVLMNSTTSNAQIKLGTNMLFDFDAYKPIVAMLLDCFGNVTNVFNEISTASSGKSIVPKSVLRPWRTNALSPLISDEMNEDCIPCSQAYDTENSVVNQRRSLFLVGMALFTFFMALTPLSAPIAVIAIIYYCWGQHIHIYAADEPDWHHFEDGVYTYEYEIFGAVRARGVGVAYKGVLHIPYHVCGGAPLYLEGRWCEVTYCNPTEDICTYGGYPKFENVEEGEEVFVTLEGPHRRTVRTTAFVSDTGFTIPKMTVPGESGSPIWKREGDELKLIGLAGRWINIGTKSIEYVYRSIDSSPVVQTFGEEVVSSVSSTGESWPVGIKRVIMHPGAGKTRSVVPNLIMAHLASPDRKHKRNRVMVLGPTRVVCKELYPVLKAHFGGKVSLHIKGSGNCSFGEIAVMAHSTFWHMYETEVPDVMHPTAIIVDEAHVDDRGTKMTLRIAEAMSLKIPVCIMSATLGEYMDDGSNFPIHEKQVKTSEMLDLVVDRVNDNKKVGVFFPTIKGPRGLNTFAEELRQKGVDNVVKLTRDSYMHVIDKVKSGEYDVLCMTNIAEMGANLDLDTVIDTGEEFKHVVNGNTITPTVRTIGQASRIQRRGRVGRKKPGEYLFVKEPDADSLQMQTSAQDDARRLAAGTQYGSDIDDLTPLSKQQRILCLKQDLPPRYVQSFFSRDGRALRGLNLAAALEDWGDGDEPSPCRVANCPCRRKAQWHDARVHDALVRLISGVKSPPIIRPFDEE